MERGAACETKNIPKAPEREKMEGKQRRKEPVVALLSGCEPNLNFRSVCARFICVISTLEGMTTQACDTCPYKTKKQRAVFKSTES